MIQPPLLWASTLGGPNSDGRFSGRMKGRNTLFFQDDLMTFLASPWLLKSSVIIQFGGREFCWSEEGWWRCQMSINLQSIIVTIWCWSRPGNELVTRPWMVEPIQTPKHFECYACKSIILCFLLAPAHFLFPCLFFPPTLVLAPSLKTGRLCILLSKIWVHLLPEPMML